MDAAAQPLHEHYVNFNEMGVQDAVKFLYQFHMGPGHLISDKNTALARLLEEWNTTPSDPNAPLSTPVGNGLCRLNLNRCKAIGLSPNTVATLFYLTANQFKPNPVALERDLSLILELPFPSAESEAFLADYRSRGCPMVRHSDTFRQRYSPAYRIVSEYYVTLIPLLIAIDRTFETQTHFCVGIDGPCACGKSTLAQALQDIYDCPLVHMDDFFLQPEQRTPQRLAEPGGNVDYERFSREILPPLLSGQPAHYRPWQCHTGTFGPEITLPSAPLTVVEGCYCLRPDLRDVFDLRVWLEAPWEVRRRRLLDRGGPDCLARFEQVWIPMENRYFDHFRIRDCCHVHLTSQDTTFV